MVFHEIVFVKLWGDPDWTGGVDATGLHLE